MTQQVALKPTVFSLGGTANLPDHPSLKGCRCKCGYVFFPRQYYGCENCGRFQDDIEDIKIAGKGELRAFATVHRNSSNKYKVPYIVANIVMDEGCAIRALLDTTDESKLYLGQTVYSTLVVVGQDSEGREVVDLRFIPEYLNE